ncbi:carboxylating nicotinate-nucleotide diphosphorylase [Sulfidibacter corallicola]|uniref:nicotinate-nucleotide diphosphorylase (carboxylating) n=1 Tax=Sulfidibacter corallicola TaxID=2818388 RepID=A0A8A4TT39_SULCO|nr:carboxylating nicotinate-nucleotide diphosphorylase [Sulfidibacter corallicola]QTD53126.1 carboxylating nicotinate-nucleotide diphosphorylase [Sulfidibacter corallicola]
MTTSCFYLERVREDVAALARMDFDADMPDGDVTADVLKLSGRRATARLFCRETVSMCGSAWYHTLLDVFREIHGGLDLTVRCLVEDGSRVEAGTTLFEWEGDVAHIVALERPFLNFLGRGIGIANATRAFVDVVRRYNDHTQILDTRKTLPGYRYFDKYAVLCGGGANHRLDLSSMVLIKENHIARLHGVREALAEVRRNLAKDVPIQIEVTDLEQLVQAIEARCPLVMLDNFSPEMVARACEYDRGDSLIEVSGGINLETIGAYCAPRPDRISVGAITHSIKAPDLSLLISED